MKTIILDTASKFLYFAFTDNGQVIYEVFNEGKNDHSDNLLKEIEIGLSKLNLSLKDFSKVIVGIGPGSYTGLRVSVTVAKMLAWTLNIPLYYVSSLDLLASGYFTKDGIYAINIKAKRNHVYGRLVEVKNNQIKILINDSFMKDEKFFESIKQYNYKLINEENYKINLNKITLVEVIDVHKLTPNYIQREV